MRWERKEFIFFGGLVLLDVMQFQELLSLTKFHQTSCRAKEYSRWWDWVNKAFQGTVWWVKSSKLKLNVKGLCIRVSNILFLCSLDTHRLKIGFLLPDACHTLIFCAPINIKKINLVFLIPMCWGGGGGYSTALTLRLCPFPVFLSPHCSNRLLCRAHCMAHCTHLLGSAISRQTLNVSIYYTSPSKLLPCRSSLAAVVINSRRMWRHCDSWNTTSIKLTHKQKCM